MRGVTLEAKCRGVERATGAELKIVYDGKRPIRVEASDPELDYTASVPIEFPSGAERAIKLMHALIYGRRSDAVKRRQNHRCIHCNERNPLEIDHIRSRGAHGRDDRMANLQGVCAYPFGCDTHRRKHGNA